MSKYNIYYYKLINLFLSIFRISPKITVGVSSYNHSQYLEECIESILQQKYKKFDVVIVDDCSTDVNNKKVLSKYKNNSKIKIIHKNKNEGISKSLNTQIENSTGEWIAFVDCDDFLPKDALLKMTRFIKRNNKYNFIYSNRIEVNEKGEILQKLCFGHRMTTKDLFEELLNGMTSSHLKIVNKKVFERVGLFNSKFDGVQDYDFYLRVAFYMPKQFGFISKFLYFHRIHNNQCTITEDKKHKKNVNIVLEEAKFRKNISKLIAADVKCNYDKNICCM